MSFVYVIQHELGPVKIGYSNNPQTRLNGLRTSCPFSLVIKDKKRVDDPEAVEAYLHKRFRKHCLGGEWFDLPPGMQDFPIPSEISDTGRPDVEVPVVEDRDMDQMWSDAVKRTLRAFTKTRYKNQAYYQLRTASKKLTEDKAEV